MAQAANGLVFGRAPKVDIFSA